MKEAFVIGLVAWLCAAGAGAGEEEIGVITAIEGRVSITRADGSVIDSAKLMDRVYGSDEVETSAKGRVKIIFEDDVLVILGPNSSAKMKEHVFAPRTNFRRFIIYLKKGSIRSILEKLYSDKSIFNVETYNAVAGVVGTDFVVEYDAARETSVVSVLRGSAEVKSRFVEGISRLTDNRYTEVVGEKSAPDQPRAIDPGMRERLLGMTVEEKTVSKQKSPPEREVMIGKGGRPLDEAISNPQVEVVGTEPIFVGGPFGHPAVPLPVPPHPHPGGGGSGTSNRYPDLGEYLGAGRR